MRNQRRFKIPTRLSACGRGKGVSELIAKHSRRTPSFLIISPKLPLITSTIIMREKKYTLKENFTHQTKKVLRLTQHLFSAFRSYFRYFNLIRDPWPGVCVARASTLKLVLLVDLLQSNFFLLFKFFHPKR